MKSDHEEIKEALSELRDGELAEPAKAEILAHLRDCADCAAAYRGLSLLGDLFRVPERAAARNTERFVAMVAARSRPPLAASADRSRLSRWLIPALSAGVASVFFAIANQEASAALDELFVGSAIASDEALDMGDEP